MPAKLFEFKFLQISRNKNSIRNCIIIIGTKSREKGKKGKKKKPHHLYNICVNTVSKINEINILILRNRFKIRVGIIAALALRRCEIPVYLKRHYLTSALHFIQIGRREKNRRMPSTCHRDVTFFDRANIFPACSITEK